jgi:hypothetical protein
MPIAKTNRSRTNTRSTSKTGTRSTRSTSGLNNGGKAPRGTNLIVKSFWEAMDGIPASSQSEVCKAAISKIREQQKDRMAASKQSASTGRTATRSTAKRISKGAGTTTRKASGGTRRSRNTQMPAQSTNETIGATTDALIN